MTRLGLRRGARRIAPLAWPVFVGQVAVIAFSTVDTVMVARTSAIDLAALAVGASVYISIFVGFMGTVLAVGPIAGQLYGAGKLHESGHEAQQAMWLGLALAVPGCLLLLFPDPFLALARSEPAVAAAGAPVPRRPGVRAAACARLHRVSRLQRRGVAAQGR
jgi:MATE family multidrug resistance protein